ncbi:hypothetical protein AMTRI_Chr05g60710 [Amborella trichopoda]
MEMDLSSMDSVKAFARSFLNTNYPLNVLINNAGIMACPYQLSKDGIELQFATNHLGEVSSLQLINLFNKKNLDFLLKNEVARKLYR